MTRNFRLIGIAALVIALGALVAAAPASAKKKKVHGQLTISYEFNRTGTDRFFGAVTSPNPRCNRGTTVNLGFKPAFEGGGGDDSPRTTVASSKSDSAGNWQIFYEVQPNGVSDFSSYAAMAPKRTLKTKMKGVKLICKYASSEPVTLFPG